jgi:hypothetical protein
MQFSSCYYSQSSGSLSVMEQRYLTGSVPQCGLNEESSIALQFGQVRLAM